MADNTMNIFFAYIGGEKFKSSQISLMVYLLTQICLTLTSAIKLITSTCQNRRLFWSCSSTQQIDWIRESTSKFWRWY